MTKCVNNYLPVPLSLFFAIALLCGCQAEETPPQHSRPTPPPTSLENTEAFASCPYPPTEGRDFSAGPQLEFSSSGYFNKIWPANIAQQALNSSSFSLIHWLYGRGVGIYKADVNSQKSCRYFAFLPTASSQLMQTWHQQPGSGSSVEGQQLLGLFRTLFRRHESGHVQMVEPTILLRQDTHRWTLLHEKAHYLFALGRAEQHNMPFVENLQDQNRELYRQLRQLEYDYMIRQQRDLATKILTTFEQFFDVNMQLFARGPLEEFSIESYLSEHAIENNILAIDYHQHLTKALFYMEIHSEPVLLSFDSFQNSLSNYSENLFINEDQVIHNRLKDLQELLKKKQEFVLTKQNQLRNYMTDQQIPFRDTRESLEVHAHYDLNLLREQLDLIQRLERSSPKL